MLGNRPDDRNEKHVQSIRLEKYGNRIFGTWKLGPRVFYASFLKISSIPNNRIVDTTNLFFFNLCASRVSRYSHYSKTSFYIYIYTYIWNRYIYIRKKRNGDGIFPIPFPPRFILDRDYSSNRFDRLVSSRSPVATTSIEPPLPKPRNVASPRGSGTRQRDPRSLHRSETRRRADPLVPPPFTAAPPSPPSFIHHPAPSFPRSILSRLDIKRSR